MALITAGVTLGVVVQLPAPDYADVGDVDAPADQTAPDPLAVTPPPQFGAETPGVGYPAATQYRSQ